MSESKIFPPATFELKNGNIYCHYTHYIDFRSMNEFIDQHPELNESQCFVFLVRRPHDDSIADSYPYTEFMQEVARNADPMVAMQQTQIDALRLLGEEQKEKIEVLRQHLSSQETYTETQINSLKALQETSDRHDTLLAWQQDVNDSQQLKFAELHKMIDELRPAPQPPSEPIEATDLANVTQALFGR